MYIIFDTETTGLPRDYNAPVSDSDNWPRLVQLAWQMHDDKGDLIEVKNFIIKPEGYSIPYNAEKIHGISTERAMRQGVDLKWVLEEFEKSLQQAKYAVGHNIEFDINIMGAEFFRKSVDTVMMDMLSIDTKNEGTEYCAIPGGKGGKFKWPTLTELHTKLFQEGFDEAHNASADVEATARCFLELIRLGVITRQRLDVSEEVIHAFRDNNPEPIALIGLNIQPYAPNDIEEEDSPQTAKQKKPSRADLKSNLESLADVPFSHLHNHSQFSVLQSTADIKSLVAKAASYNMPCVGLTDHGNMMAAYHFVKEILGHNKNIEAQHKEALEKGETPQGTIIKPVVGCEYNVCRNHSDKSVKDNGYQTVLLAKNKAGYHNLAKMSSIAYVDGFYYVPRIDKEVILQYKSDIIVTTGNMYGEVPNLILNVGEEKAEEAFIWWKEQFGDDFYVELIRHGQDEEDKVNEVLLRFAEKHDVKYFASNNTYYIEKTDANAHDILLCVKDGVQQSMPKGKGRGFRYGLPNEEYYFKSPDEMKELFKDLPDAIRTTNEISDKIEIFTLARDVLLPNFDIPERFIETEDAVDGGKRGENAYLRHLTYEGAEKRYEEITDDIRERLDFELATIENTGYPGYFLIVQDFTTEARNMGVSVGPGRGSAAGSAVAYCIGITNVDPIEYDLLFERFLNPDRVSLPDIDIDFDDEGRGKIIDWVVEKYGANQVAQIITYGTMAAKSSIRDTARALDLPLYEADRIAKLVPDIKLNKLFKMSESDMKSKLNVEQIEMAEQLFAISKGNDLAGQTLNQARMLEGSVRNTGIHACGVIITPDDITKFVPVAVAKDSDLYVTQFDNSVVESAGLLKMDFLGLKTLTIIKDAIKLIKEKHGVEIVPDDIPLDDEKTYELYQNGNTNGTFQFESPGMQKHLRALKPDKFADLIAMNALYRPGPLEYIPNFIARKHGHEEITYDIPAMEEYLGETYGITVYQEQVMLLSQSLAGFSKGDADVLRKAMGKKIFALLEKLKPKFLDGCKERGHDVKKAEKVWGDWEAFAAYAFNKSHSTCYSVVAYHTGYLKAHYPAEYMASVLTHNMNDIKKVTFFMEECKRQHIPVLGPDINESAYKFSVNDKGEIRFGLGAVKGVGGNAVDAIVRERNENGSFRSIFDVTKRVDLRTVNKRTLENLAYSGALDSFQLTHRGMYFYEENDGVSFMTRAVKFGNAYQEQLNAPPDLFGNIMEATITEPAMPAIDKWDRLYELSKEKEVVGIYISGHPLDDYKLEINNYCNISIEQLKNFEQFSNKEISFAGVVTEVINRIDKNGNPFGIFTLEDFTESREFMLFREDYLKLKMYLVQGAFVYVKARVQPRYRNNPDNLEIKLLQIQLLSEMAEKVTKGIRVRLSLDQVTESFNHRIKEIVESHPGNHNFKMIVWEPKEKIWIELLSRSHKVKVSRELIKELETFPDLKYKLE